MVHWILFPFLQIKGPCVYTFNKDPPTTTLFFLNISLQLSISPLTIFSLKVYLLQNYLLKISDLKISRLLFISSQDLSGLSRCLFIRTSLFSRPIRTSLTSRSLFPRYLALRSLTSKLTISGFKGLRCHGFLCSFGEGWYFGHCSGLRVFTASAKELKNPCFWPPCHHNLQRDTKPGVFNQ